MFIVNIFFVVLCVTAVLSQNDCQKNRLDQVKSGAHIMNGVNLGSWMVVESWMVPGLFDSNGCQGFDGQYQLDTCLGDRASSVLEQHWSTYITEQDFQEMSSRGINVVRVPVGWWQIYDPQGGAGNATLNYYIYPRDYAVGGLAHIDKVFEWGQKYGIGVLIDMHAAPGSQNGNAHSSPLYIGEIDWDKFAPNVGQTVDSMELYAERYANKEALVGFCLLNEPDHIDLNILQDYHKNAYAAVRKHSKDSWIIINSLINPFESGTEPHWIGFMNPDQGYTRVIMDLHYYSCFGGEPDQTKADDAIGYINWNRRNQISDYMAVNPKPIIIGEWSGCWHTDNSRVGEFIRAQADVFNTANAGWTFWSWAPDTEGNTWSLKAAFKAGWIDTLDTPC